MSGSALIVGAGPVGESAALYLGAAGWRVRVTSRDPMFSRPRLAGGEIARLDLARDDIAPLLEGADAVVLTPMLSLSVRAARALGGRRVIAFSSNNVAIDPEAPTYRALAEAERAFRAAAPDVTILRPTLIYGHPRLPTIARVMRWARRWPVLPMPGSGRAKQQPVLHDDLGCIAAALAQSSEGKGATFALGGPDIVTMRGLFEKAAAAANASPLITPLPRWALSAGASLLGGRFPIDAAQIARVEADRVAVPQSALPAAFAPRTGLETGLAQLAAAL